MPELESLLSTLSTDAPCGADLEYDPAFNRMEEAGANKAEQEYGNTVIAAREPDWSVVHEQATALARRTRDIRVAVWLFRSGARLRGLPAAMDALQVLRGLLERHWQHVHPQLDASDRDDPTARLNALAPLVHPLAGLADLRAASITGDRGGPTVRDIELAFGRVEPQRGETAPTETGLAQALSRALAARPELRDCILGGIGLVDAISSAIERQAGAAAGPEFAPLRLLLQFTETAARRACGSADDSRMPSGERVADAAPGALQSREDAVRALQRVCEWIEANEPSHPAPLLIRRAQRLMSKNFIDIVRDLAPDGMREVEKIAGIGTQ